MLRRDFIGLAGNSLLFLYAPSILLSQENKDREKVIKFLKEKGTKTYTLIDNQSKLNYEFDISKGETMLYQLQLNDTYFLVVNNERERSGLYFDFNEDGNVDICVEQDNLSFTKIMNNIDDVINTRKGKSTNNKNLRKVVSLEDKANTSFKRDLGQICKLLSL